MDQLKLNCAVNANLQNTINTSLILNHVRKLGTTYRSEISKALNLSLPAVSRAVDQLIESGYLIERKIITKLGRQAHEVEINALLGVSIGISIELPIMKIARMDMAGRIVTVEEIILDTGGKRIEELVMEQLEYFLKQRQFIDDREVPVVALTIAVPAAIDLDRGEVYAVLYRNMKELNIKHMIESAFTVPVFMENNENLAAIAEKHYENGIPEDNFVYMTIHHGIGAGFFLNGQLYRGANGAAGEIGYQHLGPNGFSGTKERNTFESLAAVHQIQRIALHLIHAGKGEDIFQAANYSYEQITHTLIGSLAVEGNETAQDILAEFAGLLALGVGNVLVTLNPELMVFGGQLLEIPGCGPYILEPMKQQLADLVPFPLPKFRLTRLGREASVIGACQMGLERTILRHFPYSI
ncbi:MAG: hypothetical protein A2Y31_08020 [Spirochaetes bacterium GWC2_52_13]|nr:MAG: hypothetical protein A2Y31_08020 [Spirochaetes bacterium GWC2_52_13]